MSTKSTPNDLLNHRVMHLLTLRKEVSICSRWWITLANAQRIRDWGMLHLLLSRLRDHCRRKGKSVYELRAWMTTSKQKLLDATGQLHIQTHNGCNTQDLCNTKPDQTLPEGSGDLIPWSRSYGWLLAAQRH